MRSFNGVLSIFVFTLLLTTSCSLLKKKMPYTGNGKMQTKEFTIDDYQSVLLTNKVDFIYEQKDNQAAFLEIETDANLLPYIVVEVKKKKLVIKTLEQITPTSFKVYTNSRSLASIKHTGNGEIHLLGTIRAKDLDIELSGANDVFTQDISCKGLSLKASGTTAAELSGKASSASISISGNGNVKARTFEVDNLTAKMSGSGTMQVNVQKSIEANISGSGDIKYWGNPSKVSHKVSGVGQVVKAEDNE